MNRQGAKTAKKTGMESSPKLSWKRLMFNFCPRLSAFICG
jgi:hypothetical protein